jgi:FAD-dependent halogenase
MDELVTDIVVVGGGPAGSTAATLLARAGNDVLLLERETHPRHQIGESLLPATIHGVCKLLGVWDKVHAAQFVPKRGGTFRWGRELDPWTFSFSMATLGAADYAFQVERARFDALLFEHAREEGVDAREGVEVLDPLVEDGTVVGVMVRDAGGRELRVRSSYVVDASGHESRLARHAGKRIHSQFFQNVAVYGYYRGAGRVPPPNAGNIVTSAFENGWCWFIPLSESLTSVGAVVDHRHARAIGEDRERALEGYARECPLIRDLLEPAVREREGMYGEVRVRKDWSYSNERLHMPGMLLIGDAACFIDPVFSSGVHLATYGGVLAARTINGIVGGEDPERCLSEFTRRYRREFRLFYDFLVAFYDVDQEWDDYYWAARKTLQTDERANEAFIRLVAGGASAPGDFFRERMGIGKAFSELIRAASASDDDEGTMPEQLDGGGAAEGPDLAQLNRARSMEARNLMGVGDETQPLFADGMVPSSDGLRWETAASEEDEQDRAYARG